VVECGIAIADLVAPDLEQETADLIARTGFRDMTQPRAIALIERRAVEYRSQRGFAIRLT